MPVFIPDLVGEIEIPVDGTLSRVLHRDDHVRLVAFGFDTGQELTEHTSTSAAVIQVVSGRITVNVGGTEHPMDPAAWLSMAPGEPHSLSAIEPSIVLLTLIRPGA